MSCSPEKPKQTSVSNAASGIPDLQTKEDAGEVLRCPVCQAFLPDDGVCDNPLCPAKFQKDGPPSKENLWSWKRP